MQKMYILTYNVIIRKKCLEQELLTDLINPGETTKSRAFSALPTQSLSPWGRGGGVLRMGVKIKTQKILYGYHQNPQKIIGSKINLQKNPMANFLTLQFPESKTSLVVFISRTTRLGYAGTTTNLQIVLNSQIIVTKSSQPKKHLPNFPTQKNPGIKNFKPPKI